MAISLDTFTTPQRKPSGFWRILYHPMLIASVLVHGMVLSIPMPPESDTAPEPEPEESVEIIQLSALTVRPPQPSPSPSIPATPVAAQPIRPQPAQPVSSTAPPAVPQTTPSPTPVASPSPAATPSPSSTPADLAPTPPPFDPGPQQVAFTSSIQGDLGNLQPEPSMLENPEFYFVEPGDRHSALQSGILSMQWFNKRPDDVAANLQANYGAQGYIFNAIPEGYGDGMLYELQTAEGQPFAYLNLAPGKGGASTVVVTWAANPNAATP